jgi:hypothetical protein
MVITKDGFIGIVEARRSEQVGYQTYEHQCLLRYSSYNQDKYGKHQWIADGDIAFKLSKAQESLFDDIYSKISTVKREHKYKIDGIVNIVTELHERIQKLEAKEEPNEN